MRPQRSRNSFSNANPRVLVCTQNIGTPRLAVRGSVKLVDAADRQARTDDFSAAAETYSSPWSALIAILRAAIDRLLGDQLVRA